MIIIGITGSIGMGKSTVAEQFAAFGAHICKADDIVHALLAAGGAGVAPVAAAFPESAIGGAIDRKKLGALVFNNPPALQKLEHILHPLVVAEETRFIETQRAQGASMVALDIPLLFETGAEARCDITITVSAPHFIQRWRVLNRPGMNAQKFADILRRQLPDAEKRRRADFVVQTGLGKIYSFQQVKRIVKKLPSGRSHSALD